MRGHAVLSALLLAAADAKHAKHAAAAADGACPAESARAVPSCGKLWADAGVVRDPTRPYDVVSVMNFKATAPAALVNWADYHLLFGLQHLVFVDNNCGEHMTAPAEAALSPYVDVGVATVASFGWWFMSYEGGPQLTWAQLTSASYCIGDACDAYKDRRPSTMAMSTLVLIEMFNALNSLSENRSLLTHPPSTNWWLLSAIVISMWLHMVIMYVPSFAKTFTISALNYDEWKAVFWFSIPVIFIDEVLKYVTRRHRASIVLWLKRAARKDILPRTRSSSRF